MGIAINTVKYVALTLIIFYVAVPAMLYLIPQIPEAFVYMHFLKNPFRNFANPSKNFNVSCARNFYIHNDGIRLGIWQIAPSAFRKTKVCQSDSQEADWENMMLRDNKPVIIYGHGNSFDRSARHRRVLYEKLSTAGYHTFAIDYRGFGDSTGYPSEEGMASDIIALYKYVKRYMNNNSVYFWGHSLGTGIGTLATLKLCAMNNCPTGIILEAPFNKLYDVIEHHPITLPFRWLPYFEYSFVIPLQRVGLNFDTEERLQHVSCPVMILHAHDDTIVPFMLTERLMTKAKEHGVDVRLHEFPAEFKYNHNLICNAPELPQLIGDFFNHCQKVETKIK